MQHSECLVVSMSTSHTVGLGSVWNHLWDMHYKYLLGLIIRVGYCIPVPELYQVLHGLQY